MVRSAHVPLYGDVRNRSVGKTSGKYPAKPAHFTLSCTYRAFLAIGGCNRPGEAPCDGHGAANVTDIALPKLPHNVKHRPQTPVRRRFAGVPAS